MVLNTQPIENKNYSPPTSLNSPWKWEKRHGLLLIAGICLLLWLLASKLKQSSWMKSSLEHLPLFGGLVLVSEQLLRLIS
jgi:hypothetical protein